MSNEDWVKLTPLPLEGAEFNTLPLEGGGLGWG